MPKLNKSQLKKRVHIINDMRDTLMERNKSWSLEMIDQQISDYINDPVKVRIINALATI